MLSLTARTALKRAAAAPKPGVAGSAPRFYSAGMHENDPHVLQTEKDRNLSGNQHKTSTTIDNAPGWNEYLASSSEAAVKADRETTKMEDLQHRTVKHIKDRHHTNHSPPANPREQATNTDRMKEGPDVVQAVYEREVVSGPLSGASGEEMVQEEVEVVKRGPAPAK